MDRTLINPKLPWYSAVNCQLIRIDDPRSISTAEPVLGLLLLSLVFCYQIFFWSEGNGRDAEEGKGADDSDGDDAENDTDKSGLDKKKVNRVVRLVFERFYVNR